MKSIYLGAGLVLLALVWNRGQKRQTADESLSEGTVFTDGTDWQGTLWERLGNKDIPLANAPNIGGSTNAAPSTQDLVLSGVNAGWNGSLS